MELCGSERWGPHVLVAVLRGQPVKRLQGPASGHVAAGKDLDVLPDQQDAPLFTIIELLLLKLHPCCEATHPREVTELLLPH